MLKHARFDRVFHVGFSLVLVYQSGMIIPAEAIFKAKAVLQSCSICHFDDKHYAYRMCRLSDDVTFK